MTIQSTGIYALGRHASRAGAAIWGAARRHGVTAFGPVCVSGANFVAALVVFHTVSTVEFGQFSFVIVMAALCVSLINGLLGAALISISRTAPEKRSSEKQTYLKCSLFFGYALGCMVTLATIAIGMPVAAASLFGVYAGFMSLRLVARTYSYTQYKVGSVVLSDFAYSATLITGTGILAKLSHVHIAAIAGVFAFSSLCSIASFGRSFAAELSTALAQGRALAYRNIWSTTTRWSVLGVVTSELTLNAHAYLVTFIMGSRGFALIAAGALFMRPFSLVLTALPEREGPAVARLLADGAIERAGTSVRDFSRVVAIMWILNQILTATILVFFPALIAGRGYDPKSLTVVIVLWAAIAAVRGARAADSMLLLAAREFRALARASIVSSVVALTATFILLVLAGPTASLLGILGGDIVLWLAIRSRAVQWIRPRHPTVPQVVPSQGALHTSPAPSVAIWAANEPAT